MILDQKIKVLAKSIEQLKDILQVLPDADEDFHAIAKSQIITSDLIFDKLKEFSVEIRLVDRDSYFLVISSVLCERNIYFKSGLKVIMSMGCTYDKYGGIPTNNIIIKDYSSLIGKIPVKIFDCLEREIMKVLTGKNNFSVSKKSYLSETVQAYLSLK